MFDKNDDSDLVIIDLLEQRQREYNAITERVLGSFGDCLSETIKLYSSDNSTVVLTDIELLYGMNGFIKVTGVGFPAIGAEIQVDDQLIQITEDNISMFKRVIRLVLPLKFVQSRDIESMVDFAKDLSYIIPVASDKDIEKLLIMYYNQGCEKLSDMKFYYKMLETQTRPKDIDGFTTATLTEQQTVALNLFKECTTETVN